MWLELQYIHKLAGQLKYTKTGDFTWNFRCPICGDSKISSRKKRGYLLHDRGKFHSYCHNCHKSLPFKKFLEHVNPGLYDEYIKEKFLEDGERVSAQHTPKETKELPRTAMHQAQKLLLLPDAHPARKFLLKRGIPTEWIDRLYHVPDFAKYK